MIHRLLLALLGCLLALAAPVSAHTPISGQMFGPPPVTLFGVEFSIKQDCGPLTLHLAGLHDLAGPCRGVLVRQNPWSSFDPDGLKTKEDYRKDIGRYIAEGRSQQRNLRDKFKNGEISRDDLFWQSRDIDMQQHENVRGASRAMANIEATARDIEQSTRSATGSVDGEKLNDEDSIYREFRTLHTAMQFWPGGAGTAEHASHGEYGAAAKSFAIETAVTLAGVKVLKWIGAGFAAKTTANAFDGVTSHELSKLTSKGAKDWVKGVSNAVPAKDELLRLQEIARRAVETGKQSTTNPVQSQRLQKIQEALKNLEGGN